MIRTDYINSLASAIATDSRLQSNFLADPLAAIAEHNSTYAQRYRRMPVELNEDEQQLITTLPTQAGSILEVYQFLASVIDQNEQKLAMRFRHATAPLDLFRGIRSATAA